MTKKLYLIGHPVGHSFSPIFHNELSCIRGLDYHYSAIDVLPDEFDAFMKMFRQKCHENNQNIQDSFSESTNKDTKDIKKGIQNTQKYTQNTANCNQSIDIENCVGFNVTSPYKVQIMKYLDELDESAKKTSNVNTVVLEKSILRGYNTDIQGFLHMLNDNVTKLSNKNIAVFGTGGAARSIVTACYDEKAKNVDVVSRDINRAKKFIDEHQKRYKNNKNQKFTSSKPLNYEKFNQNNLHIYKSDENLLKYCSGNSIFYDIIINSTPLGVKTNKKSLVANEKFINNKELFGNEEDYDNAKSLNIDFDLISNRTVAVDLVYNPRLTPFLKLAKSRGCKIINGLSMLMHQGSLAYEIWTKQVDVIDDMRRIFQKWEEE